jgi:hypothetical protein
MPPSPRVDPRRRTAGGGPAVTSPSPETGGASALWHFTGDPLRGKWTVRHVGGHPLTDSFGRYAIDPAVPDGHGGWNIVREGPVLSWVPSATLVYTGQAERLSFRAQLDEWRAAQSRQRRGSAGRQEPASRRSSNRT